MKRKKRDVQYLAQKQKHYYPLKCNVSGEAVGKSSLVPVPYDWILKDPSSVVVYGLPDGVTLRKPSEYDTKTLMKILEQSNRIRFIVKRSDFWLIFFFYNTLERMQMRVFFCTKD